jgi:hypothetical protein
MAATTALKQLPRLRSPTPTLMASDQATGTGAITNLTCGEPVD